MKPEIRAALDRCAVDSPLRAAVNYFADGREIGVLQQVHFDLALRGEEWVKSWLESQIKKVAERLQVESNDGGMM